MARRDRRRAERDVARQRRKIDREVAAGGEGPAHFISPRTVGEIVNDEVALDPEIVAGVRDAEQLRQRERARHLAARFDQLVASVPAHLRDTPEAQRMLAMVRLSWDQPVHPTVYKRLVEEWAAFVNSQPEAIAERTGLAVPGRPEGGHASLWTPGVS